MIPYPTEPADALEQQIQGTQALIEIHKKLPPGPERDDLAVKIHELMQLHETAISMLRESVKTH